MAVVPQSGRFVLLQMEGHMNREELSRAIDLGLGGLKSVHAKMREALQRRYAAGPGGTP